MGAFSYTMILGSCCTKIVYGSHPIGIIVCTDNINRFVKKSRTKMSDFLQIFVIFMILIVCYSFSRFSIARNFAQDLSI